MCNPALLAFIPAAVGAIGQAQQGAAAEGAAQRDAALGELQGRDALSRGGIEEERYRRQLARLIGTQKAQIGARNVRTSGTALDLLADTAQIGEEEALTIRNEAAREAWGYRTGADESRRWGKGARRASNLQAGGTLLTGAADAYGIWKSA